jgi:translocation and assembly module TamB
LLLLLTLGGATGLLLGNATGLNWLLQQPALLALVPGELRIDRVEGGLFGELRLYGLSYQDPSERLEISELYLQWRPQALWQGLLQITALEISGVHYAVLVEDNEPITDLPEMRPPLEILLERARVREVTLITSPGDTPLALQQLLLEARWNVSGISVERLSVTRQETALEASGRLTPVGAYPLAMEAELRYQPEGLPLMKLQGRLSGDLERLEVALGADGAYGARLEGRVDELLNRLRWQASLAIDRLPVELTGDRLPADLLWQIEATGDLEQLDAAIDIRTAGPAAPEGEAAGASVKLTTSLRFDTLEFDAKGGWQNLRWPLTGTVAARSRLASFTLAGDPEDYRFELQGELTGVEIPPGRWSITGHGGLQQLVLTAIEGETLGGRLSADARVAWAPALMWQLKLDARGIDPGRSWPEWPGQLDLTLGARGSEQKGESRIDLAVDKLSGQLRGYPVEGNGRFAMDGGRMRFDRVELHSGSAWLQANGTLAPGWDLAWAFEVPDLAELLPDGTGEMRGRGRLQGKGEIPVVEGTLEGKAIAWRASSLRQLKATLSLDPEPSRVSRMVLEAEGLVSAGQRIDAASLVVSGPLEDHLIRIRVDYPRGRLELEAPGAFHPDRKRWQGKIGQLELRERAIGVWRLQQPAALSVDAKALALAPLCLRQGGAAVCTEAAWTPASGTLSATLRGFSLEHLRPLLPADLTRLEGVLEADLKVDLDPLPTASLRLHLEPGEISYQVDAGHLVHLQHRGGRVDAELGRERLTARWELAVGDSGASGELDIPRRPLEQTLTRAPLTGSARFQIRQLGLLAALVPQLQETQGIIEGSLTLAGVVGAPVVKGRINLNMKQAQLPVTGITFREIELHLTGDGSERLRISGGLSSGPGRLEVEGYLSLDRQRGWPAVVTIRGERFQAVDLPDIRVLVSPDIRLEHGSNGVKLTGTLRVPEARVVLDWIPSSARKLSPDVVIVAADKTGKAGGSALPIYARVTVELGKKVHFRGFGLNADLDGRLTASSEPGRLLVGNGELGIVHGSFRALGQELNIERGRLHYAGGPLNNPGLDIKASRDLDDITVGVRITGTARKPKFIGFSSNPNLTETDALSLLLTGHVKGEGSASNTRAYIGANLTDKFSVGTRTSIESDQKEFVGRYRLSRRWSIETTTSADKSGAEVVYTIELE